MRWMVLMSVLCLLPLSHVHAQASESRLKGNFGTLYQTGYTDTLSINGGLNYRYKWMKNRFTAGVGLTYGQARYPEGEFQESTNAWNTHAEYSRYISDAERPFLWVKGLVRGDQFGGFWLRAEPSAGGGYSLVRNDNITWDVKAGANYVYEKYVETQPNGDETADSFEGVAETIFTHTVSDMVEYSWDAQYFSNFDDSQDYRAFFNAEVVFQLSEVVGLKQGLGIEYRNIPPLVASLDTDGNEILDPLTGGAILVQPDRLDVTVQLSIVISFQNPRTEG